MTVEIAGNNWLRNSTFQICKLKRKTEVALNSCIAASHSNPPNSASVIFYKEMAEKYALKTEELYEAIQTDRGEIVLKKLDQSSIDLEVNVEETVRNCNTFYSYSFF